MEALRNVFLLTPALWVIYFTAKTLQCRVVILKIKINLQIVEGL